MAKRPIKKEYLEKTTQYNHDEAYNDYVKALEAYTTYIEAILKVKDSLIDTFIEDYEGDL